MKSDLHPLMAAVPDSRGASVINSVELQVVLARAMLSAQEDHTVGGFLLFRVSDSSGLPLAHEDLTQASYVLSQFVRQSDALAILEVGLIGVVCHRLENRSDAHVQLDRIESFVRVSGAPWKLKSGVAVFPFSGASPTAIYRAALSDLERAISSDTWEHPLPRDTLLAKAAG